MRSLLKLTRLAALCLVVAILTLPGRAADLDKLAPADAEAVVVLNVKSLLDSRAFQLLGEWQFQAMLRDEKVARFLEAADFDPYRDLDRVSVTGTGIPGEKQRGCVVIRGNFNPARFEAALADHAKALGWEMKTVKDGEANYHTLGSVTLTFAGTDALVVSTDGDYLKQIVGKKVEATALNKKLKQLVGKASDKDTAFAAVALAEEQKKWAAWLIAPLWLFPKGQPLELAAKIESVAGSIQVADAVDFQLSVHATDAESAKELGQLARQGVPLYKLLFAGEERIKPITEALFAKLKITSQGSTVGYSLPRDTALVQAYHKAFIQEPAVAHHLAAGGVAQKAAKWVEADREFKSVLRHDPKNRQAMDGIHEIAEAVRADPAGIQKATSFYLNAGQTALKSERWAVAESEFKEALKLDPKNLEAADGLQKAAESRLKTAVAPHLTAGQAALKAEDLARAKAAFNEALKLDPKNVEATAGLQKARGPEKGTAALIAELQSRDRDVRRLAAEALGERGPEAKDAIPALRKLLGDISTDVQNAAKAALKKIEP